IFDNDEDKTDSAALLPCIEQAREDSQVLSFCALSLIPSVIPFRYQKGLRV
ncbi:hypothetical protein ACSJGI_002695, partial [Escherichia coli]